MENVQQNLKKLEWSWSQKFNKNAELLYGTKKEQENLQHIIEELKVTIKAQVWNELNFVLYTH